MELLLGTVVILSATMLPMPAKPRSLAILSLTRIAQAVKRPRQKDITLRALAVIVERAALTTRLDWKAAQRLILPSWLKCSARYGAC